MVEGASDVALCLLANVLSSPSESEPSSDSESSMLSTSSSRASSSSASGCCSAFSASSMRLRFSCSTSTLASRRSPSTSSQTRFLSIVCGTFRVSLCRLSSGSRSSSRFRRKRSSRRRLSRAFFCLTCKSCLRNLFSVLKGSVAFEDGATRFKPIPPCYRGCCPRTFCRRESGRVFLSRIICKINFMEAVRLVLQCKSSGEEEMTLSARPPGQALFQFLKGKSHRHVNAKLQYL